MLRCSRPLHNFFEKLADLLRALGEMDVVLLEFLLGMLSCAEGLSRLLIGARGNDKGGQMHLPLGTLLLQRWL